MWERFEFAWTAFEKFALFFSFVGTLTGLVILVMTYSSLQALPAPVPTPTPTLVPTPTSTPTPMPTPPVEPILETMREAFAKIDGAILSGVVPISHTVPITLQIRFHPDEAALKVVDKGELLTGRLVINLDDAGQLIGKDARLELVKGSEFPVTMDVSEQVVFEVPVRVDVPINAASSVDLAKEIAQLKTISMTVKGEHVPSEPASASSP